MSRHGDRMCVCVLVRESYFNIHTHTCSLQFGRRKEETTKKKEEERRGKLDGDSNGGGGGIPYAMRQEV